MNKYTRIKKQSQKLIEKLIAYILKQTPQFSTTK